MIIYLKFKSDGIDLLVSSGVFKGKATMQLIQTILFLLVFVQRLLLLYRIFPPRPFGRASCNNSNLFDQDGLDLIKLITQKNRCYK